MPPPLRKANKDWQKKIALLMTTQQKTRDEARFEQGGRGVDKEVTPAHESEKQFAESLATIVACRERMREQQVSVRSDFTYRISSRSTPFNPTRGAFESRVASTVQVVVGTRGDEDDRCET